MTKQPDLTLTEKIFLLDYNILLEGASFPCGMEKQPTLIAHKVADLSLNKNNVFWAVYYKGLLLLVW